MSAVELQPQAWSAEPQRAEPGAVECGGSEAGREAALDPVQNLYSGDHGLGPALEALGLTVPCERPLQMVDIDTGRTVSVRCGSRRQAVCASCSALYRGDAQALLRSGTVDLPGSVIVMLTLTAPSFGAVHRVPKAASPRLSDTARASWNRRSRSKCRCGAVHSAGDPLAGVALDLRTYDFAAQARWNRGTGRLWNQTATRMTRALGLDERLQYAGVAEPQNRGAMHFHFLLRVPVAIDLEVQSDSLGRRRSRRIECAVARSTAMVDGEQVAWGAQVVAEVVHHPAAGGRLTVRTIGYLSKVLTYSVKDLGRDSVTGQVTNCREAANHSARCDRAARELSCDRCGSGRDRGCPARHHKSWGYRGHPLRKSRAWGLTFRALRERRQSWARKRRQSWARNAMSEPEKVVDKDVESPNWRLVGRAPVDERCAVLDRLRVVGSTAPARVAMWS